MLGAGTTYIFGSGGSAIIALDAYHKLLRTGLRVHAVMDTHLQLMTASQMTEPDCAVLISHSGSSKDILHLLNVAKSAGVNIIAITGYLKSPLSAGAHLSLHTSSEETRYRSEAMSSRIAQLTLIDALYENVMERRGEAGERALERMREAVSVKRI